MQGMNTPVALPIDARLQEMAAVIHGVITAPDAWLEGRNRFEVLNQLWGLLARADVSLDLLLYSERECQERRQWRTHVIGRAFREGRLLDGFL